MWHVMGVMLSAGGSLRWYRDVLATGDPYEALLAPAAQVPAGAEGLIFLPYLTGERTPHADPTARGAFVGLTLRHGKAHLTRAVVEGVAFGLRDAVELTRAMGLGAGPGPLRISGGGARSPIWRQILADVLAAPVATVNVTQGAAFGAALLAAVGAGAHPTVPDAVAAIVRESSVTEPGPDAAAYPSLYRSYRELYPALAPSFRDLARG
jgi:xylulokinase